MVKANHALSNLAQKVNKLSVYMFTVYAQLQREMIKSYKVLLRT